MWSLDMTLLNWYIYIYIYACMDMCMCICLYGYVYMLAWHGRRDLLEEECQKATHMPLNVSVYVYINRFMDMYVCMCVRVFACLSCMQNID